MRFRVSETVAAPRFIVDQLQTQFIKLQILRASKDAVNQSGINQTDVKNLEIRLPPIELQRRYAGIVRKKIAADAALHTVLVEAQTLFSRLGAKEFDFALTPALYWLCDDPVGCICPCVGCRS